MKSSYTKGRLLAFTLSALFVFVLWGFIFTPNGLGANVVLGIAIAIFLVYMATTSIGPVLDDWFFHGGSRERAFELRKCEQTGREINLTLEKFKSRRNKSEGDTRAIENCDAALGDLFATINQIRSQRPTDAKGIAQDIKRAQDAEQRTKSAIKAVTGKPYSRPSVLSGGFSLAVALAAALALRIFIIEPYQIPSGSMIPTLLVGDHLFVSKLKYGIMNPLARKPSYLVRWGTPQPGEVIIFEAPPYVGHNAGQTWIKRVIAGAGQRIRLTDTVVYVDDKPYLHTKPEELVRYSDFYGAGSGFFSGNEGEWKDRTGIHTVEQLGDVAHDIYQNPVGSPERRRSAIETNWSRPENALDDGTYPGLECGPEDCKVKEGYVFVMGDNRGNSSDGRVWGALPIDNVKGKALFIWISIDGSQTSVSLVKRTLPGFRWNRMFKGIN